jgi:hypothetical protein
LSSYKDFSKHFSFEDSDKNTYDIYIYRKYCTIHNPATSKRVVLLSEKVVQDVYPIDNWIVNQEVLNHVKSLLKLKAFW